MLEKYIMKDWVTKKTATNKSKTFDSFQSRIKFGYRQAVSIVRKIWIWILVGISSLLGEQLTQCLNKDLVSIITWVTKILHLYYFLFLS